MREPVARVIRTEGNCFADSPISPTGLLTNCRDSTDCSVADEPLDDHRLNIGRHPNLRDCRSLGPGGFFETCEIGSRRYRSQRMADTAEVAAAPAGALPAEHPFHQLDASLYLRAARCQPTERVPVWFQRQAGRSLPEYRALRGEGSILDAIADPATAAEITLQPVRRYGVDAAVLFSDIVVPAAAVGFGIDVVPGVGPVAAEPLRSRADLGRLPELDADAHTPHVLETVRLLAAELDIPLRRVRRGAVHRGELPD